ncbi:MAG: M64 family metallopeptidase [Deltaproteobacteria bacterium]|nr:M64 family metallopeptidase [Deltaproteobacteria bacterium]
MSPVARALAFAALFLFALMPCAGRAEGTPAPVYADWFTDEAMRVDLVHSGTRGKELFGVDEVAAEPLWPGTRAHLIDPTGYGKYRFRVLDKATGREIFSQGYCSLFGEWMTTPEAGAGAWRSMPEPVRFPFPKAPVVLVLEVRGDKTGAFEEIERLDVDATAYDVRRERKLSFDVLTLHDGGRPPPTAVDIVIVPDGYTTDDAIKIEADARRFTRVLLGHAPFDRHAAEITVRLVMAFSRESGPDEPRKGIFRDTVVDTTFDTFRSDRYLTTSNMKALREVAANAPYDTIIVMVNSNRYGGGGIFNAFSIFTSDTEYDEYVLVHEFGHGFGALGDEYFDSSTGYEEDAFYVEGVEPWEPNVTAETDREKLKWRDLVPADVPIPTPSSEGYDGKVGVFEGAGYKAKGLYRPTHDSNMFHKGLLPFGPVNERAIETMISYYSDAEAPR